MEGCIRYGKGYSKLTREGGGGRRKGVKGRTPCHPRTDSHDGTEERQPDRELCHQPELPDAFLRRETLHYGGTERRVGR
ncbi:MAG: hypothetical protein IJ882_06695 [Paludibacteraceae bacterium]|nr:hypothetical protein [Paludibacteraceae bacterium]